MSSTAAPFGMRPINAAFGGGSSQTLRYTVGGILDGYTSNIYQGSPVKLATTGVIQVAGTAEDYVGAFWGCVYTPSGNIPAIDKFWPASTALATSTTADAWFWDDPFIMYEMQSSGSLAQSSTGDQADFVNPGSGGSVTHLSTAAISSTLAGSGTQAQLRIMGLALEAGNAWGDAYTNVQVQVARSQYLSNKVAI